MTRRRRFGTAALLAGLGAVACALGAVAGTSTSSRAVPTLYVDRIFSIETADPGRALEPTASIVDRAVFDTLFTYRPGDVAHPIPLLVTTWSAAKDARTFVFHLRHDVHFADGTPLTSADVVFSLRRLVNVRDDPSFLLAGVTVAPKGRYAVVVRSATANTALPATLANPSLGIVNAALVRRHGGTDAADAATADKAEDWFDTPASAGAGSGPYVLGGYSSTSIVLVRNRRYWGARQPAFPRVVIRNMLVGTQLRSIKKGQHEIALDLSAHQANALSHTRGLAARTLPSTYLLWLFVTEDAKLSAITPNRQFQQAVRHALDYRALVAHAGPGAIQAPGLVPSMFLGALPAKDAIRRNLARARADLAASGVAARGVTLEYPDDLSVSGLSLTAVAHEVQTELHAGGVKVTLAGEDTTTFVQRYRAGKVAFGLFVRGAAFADPSDYLVFAPGGSIGVLAGWAKGADPAVERLADEARVTTASTTRQALYQQLQRRLNGSGPFFPLLQPGRGFVATDDLRQAVYNPQYEVDVTQVAPR
jgi:peptide/nickel transport system substrate-binding protein